MRGIGILEVEADASRVIYATKEKAVALAVDPDGGVWASFYEDGTVYVRDGKAKKISRDRYQRFSFRSGNDGFGVRDDIEWSIDHWDGRTWKPLRTRRDFHGRYDDNKFQDLAVGPRSIWVSSWNGLARLEDGAWHDVPSPSEEASLGPWRTVAWGDGVILRYGDGYVIDDGGPTRPFEWPAGASLEAINGAGLAVGSSGPFAPLVIGSAVADGRLESATSVGILDDKFVDASGRTWVATPFSLLVIAPTGALLGSWSPGTLDGLEGPVDFVVARGRGPTSLPPPSAAKRYQVRGRVEIYKSGAPYTNGSIQLCAGYSSDCTSSGYAVTVGLAADGSFVFEDVPPTELTLRPSEPVGLPECDGIFSGKGLASFVPTRDCPKGSTSCSVGTIQMCTPFEMPPPH